MNFNCLGSSWKFRSPLKIIPLEFFLFRIDIKKRITINKQKLDLLSNICAGERASSPIGTFGQARSELAMEVAIASRMTAINVGAQLLENQHHLTSNNDRKAEKRNKRSMLHLHIQCDSLNIEC